jgi:PAS domain S-box-containing protein
MPSILVPTLAAFGWCIAAAALWCVLGMRSGTGAVRTLLMALLLGVCGPVMLLIQAGISTLAETALPDAGLLGIVIVLSSLACAAALQFALSSPPGVARAPSMSLLVSVLLGIGLSLSAEFAAPLLGSARADAATEAPAWIRLALIAGVVVTLLAVFLRGFRDRSEGELSAAIVTREIRRRKETMQALNDLEQSYRQREAELTARHQLLLDGAHVGLWEFDLVTRGAHFSERFAGMLGYSLKEIVPSTSEYLRLVHPDDLPLVLNRIQALVDGDAPTYVAEFRMRHKDGSYRRIQASGVALRDANGRAVRMAGAHSEIVAQAAVSEPALLAPETDSDAAPDFTFKRQGLWESWSPLEHAAESDSTAPANPAQAPTPAQAEAPSGDGTFPTIDPNALR